MNTLLAFSAALVALRLAGALAKRWRATRRPELAAWAWSLAAYAIAAAAIAWGEAAQWDSRVFRVYYAAGALLVSFPVVLLFLILSRYLISGLSSGAVKG